MLGLNPILNLLAEERGQYEIGELAAYSFGPLVVALVLFWVGIKLQHAGKPTWIKWTAMIPLALGLILGIGPVQKFFGDPLYQTYYGGTWKKAVAHAMGVVIPILAALGLVVWNKVLSRQKFEEL